MTINIDQSVINPQTGAIFKNPSHLKEAELAETQAQLVDLINRSKSTKKRNTIFAM